jgi:TrmH family RNA methyltransferase
VNGSNAPPLITSASNPAIALARELARSDRRAAAGAFLVEGVRAVRDALETEAVPRLVLVREDTASILRELRIPSGTPVRLVTRQLFDRLSDVQTPQGLLAVFPMPDLQPDLGQTPLVLVVDRLRDPGNLGTLLRAAAGAGVSAIYRTPHTVDPWNPKVVRAGMGAHFRVPVVAFDANAGDDLRRQLPRRVIATAAATRPYDAIDWTGPAALVIGGEAEGVSAELAAWGTEEASIPLANDVESLNAAIAGAVVLFEAARQRRLAG